MFNISGFFERFKQVEMKEIGRRLAIAETVKKHTQIDLVPEKITFQSAKIIISASPIEKNQIFMKKTAILAEVCQKLAPTVFTNIG